MNGTIWFRNQDFGGYRTPPLSCHLLYNPQLNHSVHFLLHGFLRARARSTWSCTLSLIIGGRKQEHLLLPRREFPYSYLDNKLLTTTSGPPGSSLKQPFPAQQSSSKLLCRRKNASSPTSWTSQSPLNMSKIPLRCSPNNSSKGDNLREA